MPITVRKKATVKTVAAKVRTDAPGSATEEIPEIAAEEEAAEAAVAAEAAEPVEPPREPRIPPYTICVICALIAMICFIALLILQISEYNFVKTAFPLKQVYAPMDTTALDTGAAPPPPLDGALEPAPPADGFQPE